MPFRISVLVATFRHLSWFHQASLIPNLSPFLLHNFCVMGGGKFVHRHQAKFTFLACSFSESLCFFRHWWKRRPVFIAAVVALTVDTITGISYSSHPHPSPPFNLFYGLLIPWHSGMLSEWWALETLMGSRRLYSSWCFVQVGYSHYFVSLSLNYALCKMGTSGVFHYVEVISFLAVCLLSSCSLKWTLCISFIYLFLLSVVL